MTTHTDSGKQNKIYFTVIAVVLSFVFVSFLITRKLHLPTSIQITTLLAIAIFQVTLSAAYFMHLNAEKRIVYGVLLLTGFFFATLLLIPVLTHGDNTGTRLDTTAPAAPAHAEGGEGH